MVITRTKTPEEVDRVKEAQAWDSRGDCGNKTITTYAFEGEMKEGPISRLLITEIGHRTTQLK